jgi:hypothetical protein
MEVELARRRGEKLLEEDERRGRPEKSNELVALISKAETMQRSRARTIAREPAAVAAYVQQKAKAERLPSA